MIISKLSGGMGNQLFQYALGRKLALKNKVPLALDITPLHVDTEGKWSKREYVLGAFCIDAKIIDTNLPKLFYKYIQRPRYIKEKCADQFDPSILQSPKDVYLDGTWLSEKYFADIRGVLLKDLQLKNDLSEDAKTVLHAIETTESVAVHVRRGDNVSNPKSIAFHGSPSKEEYGAQMRYISEHVANPHFFVFSDDFVWCKEHISSEHPTTFIEGNTTYPHEDLHLMSRCKHILMSNSTLSWWGAWLNENPNKMVLRPKRFTLGAFDTKDFYPESWLNIW